MTVLKDFFAECLFEVTDNFIDDAANTSVLHIGDDHIEDWKVVKRHLDKHDIATRPQNMTELYECLGFKDIDEVRQGKYFEIEVKENDPTKAKGIVEDMCKKLLVNLIIEDYKVNKL